jgi:hypothetical protein
MTPGQEVVNLGYTPLERFDEFIVAFGGEEGMRHDAHDQFSRCEEQGKVEQEFMSGVKMVECTS